MADNAITERMDAIYMQLQRVVELLEELNKPVEETKEPPVKQVPPKKAGA